MEHGFIVAKAADTVFTWVIILAIAAVVVSNQGSADKLIKTIGDFIASAVQIILSPANRQGGNQ